MTRRGHVPRRLCAGCGRRSSKEELVRFTVAEAGGRRSLALDLSGKGGGRGSYVCSDSACLEKALKKKALLRGLGDVTIPEGLSEEFRHSIEARR